MQLQKTPFVSMSRVGRLHILVTVLALVFLTACGGSPSTATQAGAPTTAPAPAAAANTTAPAPAAADNTNEPVTLRFALALEPARLESYTEAINTWNAEHPNIQVKIENTPFGEFYQKLQVLTASKTTPDVWLFVPGYASHWLESNQLLPLDE